MSRKIKLTVQYDGTGFCGFELQPGQRSVRGEIEKALFKAFKTPVKFISASRTDAGVHALGQVISFSIKSPIPLSKLHEVINNHLPEDIRAVKAEIRPKNFHARHAAKSKEYEYLIYSGNVLPPQLRKIVWHLRAKLDLKNMRKAAKYLLGKHDFSSFCAAHSDDNNFARIIHKLVIRHSSFVIWGSKKIKMISIKVTGNGFLYKMVRNMAGTLVEVGLGKRKAADIKEMLKARDRKAAGRTAPSHGLCLLKIRYI